MDIPKMQAELDKMVSMCYPFMEYRNVAEIHSQIMESKLMLKNQYKHYKEILDNNGAIK